MRKERKQFLQDFDEFVEKRIASGISRAEFHIRLKDWKTVFISSLEEKDTRTDDEIITEGWKALTKASQNFVKTRQKITGRQSFKAMGHRAHTYSKDLIKISLVGVPRKLAGKGAQKLRAAGEPSTKWVDNAMNQYKKHLKNNMPKNFKMPTRIEAEHGTKLEGEGRKGQSKIIQPQGTSRTPDITKRPGAIGNNAANAVIQAMKKSVERQDSYVSIFIELGMDFFNERFLESNVTKRKSIDKFIAEAKTSLVLIPNRSPGNTGLLDTKDIAYFRQQLFEATEAYMKSKRNMPDFEQALATSPKITDEVMDYGIKGITKKMIESAGFRLTRTGAIDRRSKGITKKGGFDMRFKFNQELQKKMALKNEVKKDRARIRKRVKETKRKRQIKKATGVAIGGAGGVKRVSTQSQVDRNIQGIALKDVINAVLGSVVQGNMGSPALNYRGTGRHGPFTTTVRAENVLFGPRGGLTIDYTYALFPYQTFEPGFAQGSTLRDPRKLIGSSIKEIVAANMKGMQPLLRRV